MRLQRWLLTVPLRLRSLLRRSAVERDLADEIEDYLERGTAAGMATGLSREDARAAALRAFGGLEPRKEECRDAPGRAIEHLVRTSAGRVRLRASPSFWWRSCRSRSGSAQVTIFQLLNALRLRPLPVSRPHELVAVGSTTGAPRATTAAVRTSPTRCGSGFAIGSRRLPAPRLEPPTFDHAATGESRFVGNGLWVSGDFFNLLGVAGARRPSPRPTTCAAAAPGVVLSYDFWRRAGGRDRWLPSA